jgi:adenylyltransferase/sulfurtransferase
MSDEDTIAFESPNDADRYARHRLIPWWDQELLSLSKVLVVGAGALGNEVLKDLALLGVGHIMVVDFDVVELSNLSRSVLFSDSDIGRPKAQAAAEATRNLNPQIDVDCLVGDVELDLGLNAIGQFDIVLGCLDSVNARWAVNRACMHVGTPWINGGISATAGEVAFFHPKAGGCYECGMTEGMWRRFNERYSCMLLLKRMPAQMVPTTAVVASLTASLQVNEAIGYLHQAPETLRPGQKLFFSVKPYSFFIVDILRDSNCLAHESYVPQIRMAQGPDELNALQVLNSVAGSLSIELDFDLALSLRCPVHGELEVCCPVKKIPVDAVPCPNCGVQRVPRTIHEIGRSGEAALMRLKDIGIPENSILRVRTKDGTACVTIR